MLQGEDQERMEIKISKKVEMKAWNYDKMDETEMIKRTESIDQW